MPRRAAPPAPSEDLIRFAVDCDTTKQLKILLSVAKTLGLAPHMGSPGDSHSNGFDDAARDAVIKIRRNRRNGDREEKDYLAAGKSGKPGPKRGAKSSRPKRYPPRMMVRMNPAWDQKGLTPRTVKIWKTLLSLHQTEPFMKGAAKGELRKKLKGVHVTGDITLLMDIGAIVAAPDAPLPAKGDYRKALHGS